MSLITIIIICLIIYIIIIDKFYFINYINNLEIKQIIINLIYDNKININKLYNFPSNIITIILINYLLFTLIITVKITNFSKGPLRKIN